LVKTGNDVHVQFKVKGLRARFQTNFPLLEDRKAYLLAALEYARGASNRTVRASKPRPICCPISGTMPIANRNICFG
jgi:hypothetical protein